MVRGIPYLSKVDSEPELLTKLIFTLKPQSYEEGDLVLAENNKSTSIIFVERGTVEVVTLVNEYEYIIDKLGEGSHINYRAYITGDSMVVNFRAG
jgi:signal-transduction protein with cAMP-binding, CBS, and nucleotidyltransferase domain